jgi:hypothetical protein
VSFQAENGSRVNILMGSSCWPLSICQWQCKVSRFELWMGATKRRRKDSHLIIIDAWVRVGSAICMAYKFYGQYHWQRKMDSNTVSSHFCQAPRTHISMRKSSFLWILNIQSNHMDTKSELVILFWSSNHYWKWNTSILACLISRKEYKYQAKNGCKRRNIWL